MRPTAEELKQAASKTLPDVIAAGLRVLFVGINPGLYSAAVGHHFGRPGNRFWPALHLGGFTPRLLSPGEQFDLLPMGLGITNIAPRASARAEELTAEELVAGGRVLARKVKKYKPLMVAVLGVTAYRTAFARPEAKIGPQQETLAESRLWVLPNPSGLNAHYRLDDLGRQFAELRTAVESRSVEPRPRGSGRHHESDP